MSRRFISSCIQGALLLSAIPVYAEDVPTVVVSATRSEQSSVNLPATIKIITQEEIANSGSTNVAEVLRRQAGLVISDQYGDGSRVSIGIRGFGETANANTLVMVDGRRLNNPDIANQDIYSIPLEDIERIEIIHGSAGVLFGDQAVGGVINIITRSSTVKQNNVELLYGSYDKTDFLGRFSGSMTDALSYKVIIEDRQSDNYRDHNAKDYQQLQGYLGYQYEKGMVFGEFQYVDDKLETPGSLLQADVEADRQQALANFQHDFSNLKTNSGRIGSRHAFSKIWSTEAELTNRSSDGVFRLSSVSGAETENAYQEREVNEFTPRLIGAIPFMSRELLLTLGVDVVKSDYMLSSRFGDQFNDQSMISEYAQGIVPLNGNADVTIGFRHAEVNNELRDAGSFAIYSSGINIDDEVNVWELGIKHRLDNGMSLHARVDENYRFAKVEEFMQPGYSLTFEPIILNTQTGKSYEMGLDWLLAKGDVSLSIYKLDLNDEIVFDPVNYANINIDATNRKGLLLGGNMDLTASIVAGASASLVRTEVESGSFAGNDIPFVPETQANAFVDYKATAAINIFGELNYTGERVLSGDFTNTLQKLPSYTILNLAASYHQDNIIYNIRVNNLLDKQYSEFGLAAMIPPVEAYYPSPERNFVISANIGF